MKKLLILIAVVFPLLGGTLGAGELPYIYKGVRPLGMGGTFTALSPMFRIDTGAAATGMDPHQATIDPPLAVTRAHGHALTARVQGNDAAAALTLALNGWYEDED